jgi:glucose-6-phosphate 1-dehydrogenase
MIRHFLDREELSWTVAEELCLLARRTISARGRFDLALLGRAAAETLRALLGEPPFRDRVDWQRVRLSDGGDLNVAAFDLVVLGFEMSGRAPATLLQRAGRVWCLIFGSEQAAALRAALARPDEPEPVWFLDRDAARALDRESSTSGIATRDIAGNPLVVEAAADPCAFVIFGAGGDLTRRKLVPALYNLVADGKLPEGVAVIGVSRERTTPAELREQYRQAVEVHSRRKPIDGERWRWLAERIDYVGGGFEEASTFEQLRARLAAADRDRGTRGNRLYYLAVPPSAFEVVVEQLHRAGLLYERQPRGAHPWCRVMVEKPFGHDLPSARALNRELAEHLTEAQLFRVDHYLGKETVQNILVLRFGNTTFEPLWNRRSIDHVQITAAESIGLDRRGRFYDATGVLRDVVQSHLLQVLALVAAEVPLSFAADDVRDAQAQLLRSLHPLAGPEVAGRVVRAQYRGYTDEEGVAPRSRTPTYVAMKVTIDNWRWKGVPFYLRAGKRLARRLTEVTIHYQPIPVCLFRPERDGCQNVEPNVLTLRIQPDEAVSQSFVAKVPGDHLAVSNVLMNMNYASTFGRPIAEAYERLLLDVMRGDQMLFARADVVEHAWRFVQPILDAWDADEEPLAHYEPGSEGPPEADELLARDGRHWRKLG